MCQTNVYAVSDGAEELLMESVARVEVDGGTLRMRDVFGDRLDIAGRILEVNFQGGRLVIGRS